MNTRLDKENEILHLFLAELKQRDRVTDEYSGRPIEFLAKGGSYYPPVMQQMFMDIYFDLVTRAIIIGPRGGGKTYFLGDLAAAKFLFNGFDALIASGGENQAKEVYDEVVKVLGDDDLEQYVPTMTTQVTRGKRGNWIRFVPASTKRARGPHPGRGHGGIIILDEEGEMDEAIVNAVLGTGSTANPLIIIRASTAHNIDGTFADLLEHYDERGYKLYRWDAFDVAKKCTHRCSSCFPEFREDYCRGKARRNSELGWISIEYLRQMWIEQTKEWFEVEMMGMRPSGAGLVINRDDFQFAVVDRDLPRVKTAEGAYGIDWGFRGMTAVLATQLTGDKLQVFDRARFTGKGIEVIIAHLKAWQALYGIGEVLSDSSHPFENDALRKAGFKVTEVTFVSFKEAGAGAVTWFFEKRRIEIAATFKDVIDQLKKWRRDATGKIIKKDDHYADALLCTMMKWWQKTRRQPSYTRATRSH